MTKPEIANSRRNYMCEVIAAARQKLKLTQDEFGARYGVSGPAIFKFEQGLVRPSLELWMQIAMDAGVSEHRAVLLWAKSKLPPEYQDYIELQGVSLVDLPRQPRVAMELAGSKSRSELRSILARDNTFPEGLKFLVEDDKLWALYKPTGKELLRLHQVFGGLGKGSGELYRQALCLLRDMGVNDRE